MLGSIVATAGGGNETSSMQGMMTSGMQNISQFQQLKNIVFCSFLSCSTYFDSISLAMTSNSDTASPENDLNNNGLLDSRA
jgi:hypothetical protein